MPRQREEVLNVVLAQLIWESGVAAAPESITQAAGERAMPDVIVTLRGLRCAIEGKLAEVTGAKDTVLGQAKERVATGIAHMAIAVVYPGHLRSEPFSSLPATLRETELEFVVHTEAGEDAWRRGLLETILADLRRSYLRLASDDVVERSVILLKTGMEGVVNVLMAEATAERLAKLLGVFEEDANE